MISTGTCEGSEAANGAETLTKPNNMGENGAELKQAVLQLDPLGVMPEVGHLLPPAAPLDLTAEARKPESGSVPLRNRKREEFCKVLTGWGGDGLRKRNHEAYTAVYGKTGATARTQSSWLLSIPEVRDRVEWLERKVEEAKRHDYRAAQQEIDELRLGIIERGKKNSKLAAVALAAARDFEAAHGLAAKSARSDAVEVGAVGAIEVGDGLNAVRAILAKVVRRGDAG